MRYENSLTSKVQLYIDEIIADKIAEEEKCYEIYETAMEIRKCLCDTGTINTSDYVIRRFIQTNHGELLPDKMEIPDLTNNGNVSWDSQVINEIAKSLAEQSKVQGARISVKEWTGYLSGSGVAKREKVFRIAFTLKMGVEDTVDLLMALSMETYSVKNPLDFICLFCQKTPGRYSWSEVEDMLKTFMTGNISQRNMGDSRAEYMTRQIMSDLEEIFFRDLPDADAKEALVKYMVDHPGGFVSYKDGKKDIYLEGYSSSRMSMFMRLSQYLAVLYPDYYAEAKVEEIKSAYIEGNQDGYQLLEQIISNKIRVNIKYDEEGYPQLSFLVRAMFDDIGWKYITWNKVDQAPDKSEYNKNSKQFEDRMRMFCENYEQHIMKIERLRKGGRHVAFFERRDALLFTFFLLDGYIKLSGRSDPEARRRNETLNKLRNSKTDFDGVIDYILQEADSISLLDKTEQGGRDHFNILRGCFNAVLHEMGYKQVYLPSVFDRFVLLSLMSEKPEELTPLIMCQADLEDYKNYK